MDVFIPHMQQSNGPSLNLNPNSQFGRLLLKYYGTTNLDQIAAREQLQTEELNQQLENVKQLQMKVFVNRLPKIKHTLQYHLLRQAYKSKQLRIHVVNSQTQQQLRERLMKQIESAKELRDKIMQLSDSKELKNNSLTIQKLCSMVK